MVCNSFYQIMFNLHFIEVHEAMKELQQLYQLPGDEAQRVLREEIVALEEQVGQQEKRAAQVSDWMYQDAQVCLL